MSRSDRKYTIDQVAEIVYSEGLDYAIQQYLSADSIEEWTTSRRLLPVAPLPTTKGNDHGKLCGN